MSKRSRHRMPFGRNRSYAKHIIRSVYLQAKNPLWKLRYLARVQGSKLHPLLMHNHKQHLTHSQSWL